LLVYRINKHDFIRFPVLAHCLACVPVAVLWIVMTRLYFSRGRRAGIKSDLGPEAAKALVTRIFANVPVLDGGGRSATTGALQRRRAVRPGHRRGQVALMPRAGRTP
jgi:hypothetical protein